MNKILFICLLLACSAVEAAPKGVYSVRPNHFGGHTVLQNGRPYSYSARSPTGSIRYYNQRGYIGNSYRNGTGSTTFNKAK